MNLTEGLCLEFGFNRVVVPGLGSSPSSDAFSQVFEGGTLPKDGSAWRILNGSTHNQGRRLIAKFKNLPDRPLTSPNIEENVPRVFRRCFDLEQVEQVMSDQANVTGSLHLPLWADPGERMSSRFFTMEAMRPGF